MDQYDYRTNLTADQVKGYLDGNDDELEEFNSALEEGQGRIASGEKETVTILVTITKE